MYPIITISREFCSGGDNIGMKVAKALDIPYLDRDMVEKVAYETGFDVGMISDRGEYVPTDDTAAYPGMLHSPAGNPDTIIFMAQQKLILEQAKKGPCVIIGRCADYFLAEAGIPSLNVFIHSSLAYRKAFYKDYFKDDTSSDEKIEKMLRRKNLGRTLYYRLYTNREWSDYKNYQINLDCSALGEDACAEFITKVARSMDK